MWLYRTSGDTSQPIVLYDYQPGRGACHPKTFLAGFKGYLHTDGYSGYHSLPNEITVVGYWAHARRKFDEAMKLLKNTIGSDFYKFWSHYNIKSGKYQILSERESTIGNCNLKWRNAEVKIMRVTQRP